METGKWATSIGAVYAFMFFCGWFISWLSGYLQCGKMSISENAKQGAIWASYPTGIYALSTYVERVRSPFVNTLSGFGVPESMKDVVGVGYLVMLSVWIATVWNLHSTTKAVCNPSVDEMSEFKKNLLKKLEDEQKEEQANKEKTTEIAKTSTA